MADPESLEGGCLCQAVRYRAWSPWLLFVHCHCSRCRRASGGAHATNLFTAPERLEWLRGETQVQRYELPSARSFGVGFCRRCGSPAPFFSAADGAWIIPAGSLDAEPGMLPSARLHWASRTAWSCDGDPLSRFETEPELLVGSAEVSDPAG